MGRQRTRRKARQRDEPQLAALHSNEFGNDWYAPDEFELGPLPDDVWDVFELDDETTEPQPEPGDFWGAVYDEEEIWAA